MLVVIGKGTIDAYGFDNIWDKNRAGGRLLFPESERSISESSIVHLLNVSHYRLTLDLNARHSALALLVGGTTYFTYTFTLNQGMVQRYLSLPTVRKAKYALSIYIFTVSILIAICCFAGLIAFNLYSQCDPLKTKVFRFAARFFISMFSLLSITYS